MEKDRIVSTKEESCNEVTEADDNTEGAVDGINYGWKKRISIFFTGQMITFVGSMLVQYAIIWYITQSYKSGIMNMIAVICGFLPQAVVSLFAGVWADRYSKKALIILSDIGIAVVTLGAAVLFIFGIDGIWLLFLVLGLRSIGQGIQTPALNAFIPDIVPKEKLLKVNGFMGSFQAVITVIPIALGGVLYFYVDLYIIFFIDILTAIIGSTIIGLFIKTKKVKEPDVRLGYFDDLKSGLKYVFSNRFLKVFFVFYAICMFIIAPASFLSPLQVARSFNNDEWRLAAVELLFAIGMIIGGIIISFWKGFKSHTKTISAANVVFGVFTIVMGIVPILPLNLELNFGLYLATMLILGCTIPFFNAPSITVLQETADPQMIGRVFGIVNIVSSFALPLGMLLFGPLADVIAIEWLLAGTGMLIVLYGFVLSKNKTLKNYKDYAYKSVLKEKP